MSAHERDWMYRRLDYNGFTSSEFESGVKEFVDFAISQYGDDGYNKIRCPCPKCDNLKWLDCDTVNSHLCASAFIQNYRLWIYHGETLDRGRSLE